MWIALLSLLAQDPPVTFGITVVIPNGLEGQIYNLRHGTSKLPHFKTMRPVGTIYTTTLNIPPQDFKQGFPGVTTRFEWFAIDYKGRFWAEKEGVWNFFLLSDDGSKLYIDGAEVIDNDGPHEPKLVDGWIRLARGPHDIRVSYYQGPRYQVALVLKVIPPGEPIQLFNTNELKPPPEP